MSCFTKALKGLNEYRSIVYDLNNRRLPAGVVGLSAIHKAHVISAACEDLAPHRAIIITPDEAQAAKLCKDLNAFGCEAQLYPAGDLALRPDSVKSREYEHKRLSVLGNLVDGKVRAVVCSVEAALQYTIPPEELIYTPTVALRTLGALQDDAYAAARGVLTESGYMNVELYINDLEYFKK